MGIRPEFDKTPRNMEPIRPNDQQRVQEELRSQNDRGDVHKAYRVEEMTTQGWALVDPRAVQLPRQKAKDWLDYMMNEGRAPNDLRAVPERPVRENYQEKIKNYEAKLNRPNGSSDGKNVTINVDKDVNVTINET